MNSALLDEVIGYIKANPQEWNQYYWVTYTECGTAYCVAGWAAILSGWEERSVFNSIMVKDGVLEHIEHIGRCELGLTIDQAELLFNGKNSLDQIEKYAKDFANNIDVDEPYIVQ